MSIQVKKQTKGLWSKRVVEPVMSLLNQGLTVDKITHSLAAGAVISIFPIWGTTVTLSFVAVFLFRLNVVAVMVANFAMYPVQIGLIVPYIYLGQWLFGKNLDGEITLAALQLKYNEGWGPLLANFGEILLKAGGAWILTAPFWYGLFYYGFRPLVRSLSRRVSLPPR